MFEGKSNIKSDTENMKEQFIRDGDKVIPITGNGKFRRSVLEAKYAKIVARYLDLKRQNPRVPKNQICKYICAEFGHNALTIYKIVHNYGY